VLKSIFNEARMSFDIETTGPLLVRSGHASVSGPDMTPVRTYRNGRWEVFIPGSSLKGVIRSHAEKIVRTIRPGVACNPFLMARDARDNFGEVACGDKFERREKDLKERVGTETAYADSCPICRLFGSTEFIGRASVNDAYLAQGQSERRELRDGVGIDRLTGGASDKAKFELEAVSSGTIFTGELQARNFECWQLGLLLAVLMDMEEGMVRVGGGRSRGFGAVKARIKELEIHHFGVQGGRPAEEVWGLGRFLSDGKYRTNQDDALRLGADPGWQRRGLRSFISIKPDHVASLRDSALSEFVRRMEGWRVPDAMTPAHFRRGGR
jgi:CRISPR-associated RAMP protein (TIGR02581 family)